MSALCATPPVPTAIASTAASFATDPTETEDVSAPTPATASPPSAEASIVGAALPAAAEAAPPPAAAPAPATAPLVAAVLAEPVALAAAPAPRPPGPATTPDPEPAIVTPESEPAPPAPVTPAATLLCPSADESTSTLSFPPSATGRTTASIARCRRTSRSNSWQGRQRSMWARTMPRAGAFPRAFASSSRTSEQAVSRALRPRYSPSRAWKMSALTFSRRTPSTIAISS